MHRFTTIRAESPSVLSRLVQVPRLHMVVEYLHKHRSCGRDKREKFVPSCKRSLVMLQALDRAITKLCLKDGSIYGLVSEHDFPCACFNHAKMTVGAFVSTFVCSTLRTVEQTVNQSACLGMPS